VVVVIHHVLGRGPAIPLLVPPSGDRLLLPLLTFPKDLLPPAHVFTRDERGDWISLEESGTGRRIAYAILLAAAQNANLCTLCAPAVLWDLADSNTITAHKAWRQLGTCMHLPPHPRSAAWTPNAEFVQFVMIARLLYRSVLLTVNLSRKELGCRKIVSITYDGPIRVVRGWREVGGLSPLVIAPRAAFGGNAKSYHLQVFPSERLTVVDSRMLYSYFSPCPVSTSEDLVLEGSDALLEEGDVNTALKDAGIRHWWGSIEGPADPMSSHIRGSGQRIPKLETGRDAYGVFQLYPQFSGSLTQMLTAGFTNLAFVWAFVAGLQFHHLRPVLSNHPEVIFIVAALVVGFGVGLTLYPKEHLLTSSVLRPWRRLEAVLIGFTIAVPITSLWRLTQVGPNFALHLPMPYLWVEAGLDLAVFVALFATSVRPYFAETSGRPRWRRTGLAIRRMSFPNRGEVIDDREIARREMDPEKWGEWLHARHNLESRKVYEIKRKFVDRYLVERGRQDLFNRGVPPAVRHARDERAD